MPLFSIERNRMPRIAGCLGCLRLAAALCVLCICLRASADDVAREMAPAPPRVLDAQAARGAAFLNGGDDGRAEPADDIPPAPARLPVRFQRAEHQVSAPTEVGSTPGPAPQKLPPQSGASLTPFSKPGRAGLHSSELSTLLTGAASLGIVLGLFLLVVWVVRRGTPKNSGLLPREAVEVLGRAPLVGRQHMHLVRCANKILLIYASPTGVETLTEITDPAEVDHLRSICQPEAAHGVTSSFRHVFGQFEPRSHGLEYPLQPAGDEADFEHLNDPRGQTTRV